MEEMTISFDEKEAKSNVPIFNNGQAGKVTDVTITALKKGVDYEGDRTPDYKIKYSDSNGSIEMGYYYLNEEDHNPQYGTFEESLKKQWDKVGSILKACGESSSIKVDTPKEMLDTLMNKIRTATKGKTFNVFANYGHVNTPKRWLQIRSWTPFVELSGTEPSKLKATKIDQLERLAPDTNSTNNTFPNNLGNGSSNGSWTD